IAAAIGFSDVTTTAGLADVPPLPDTASDVALATGDYDGDGSEDVFVAGRLFHNELARATETTARAGIRLRDRAVAAAFGDYDNDGRLDLFVATANGGRRFRNAGDSSFTDVTAAAGLGTAPPATTALFVDLDHDGDLDLFLATPAGNRVYRNVRNGQFQEMAGPMGLGGGGVGGTRDAAFGDFDGDGHVDLVVVGEDGSLTLFRNRGQGRFEDATAASGLAQAGTPGRAAAVAVGDYDNDGFLDLFVAAPGGTAPVLYRNRGGNANQYVQVQLAALGTGSGKNNRFGIGSTLELRAGQLYEARVVTGRVTHFGLGQRLKADVLRARWPNGVAQTVYYPGTDE